jgi:hypothetical protein
MGFSVRIRQVWHRPCCEKTPNKVEINHIVLPVQIAHIQTLPANVASLNRMTVKVDSGSVCSI